MFEHRKRKSFLSLSTSNPNSPLSVSTRMASPKFSVPLPHNRLKDVLLLLSIVFIIYVFFHSPPTPPRAVTAPFSPSYAASSRHHLVFAIASSSASFVDRIPYLKLWYDPDTTRAFVFVDGAPAGFASDPTLPPLIVSEDTSRFPYTYKGGLKSAVRVARVVKEIVELNQSDVRWFVFGDDDTLFFVDNLLETLSKYDHNEWYYIGSNSESYDQNLRYSFDMAFGGGGFAISYPLAKVLARVLDSCLIRYANLYGSDARIFSCLAELGVTLTHEPGFHQVDMRGSLFGLLSAHPVSPLVSLHHLDAVDAIFPSMNRTQAMHHLFEAVSKDHARILQQTVCYDRKNSLTVSVAWGYSVQVFEGNEPLPDLILPQRTFRPWRRSRMGDFSRLMFNVREYPKNPCKRPAVFFMEKVSLIDNGIWSTYRRHREEDCSRANAVNNLERIRVFSHKLESHAGQMIASRRQCCDVSGFNESMVVSIRQCGVDELISMH
ncbi:hypothetical protein K2173_018662 [Erythroxylum novogranatense]|uniref:Uncharacterized protein n=1 Tax=Erythroxylum novogranatense TaxID=1862640 RepID=A0AAV8SB24_9ROSI|nr:hypothetical protein K2173_018662 [Erythroxylum novogranatense]